MELQEVHEKTCDFAQMLIDFYGNPSQDARNSMIFKGPFAGWTLGGVVDMAKRMKENSIKYPLQQIKGE